MDRRLSPDVFAPEHGGIFVKRGMWRGAEAVEPVRAVDERAFDEAHAVASRAAEAVTERPAGPLNAPV